MKHLSQDGNTVVLTKMEKLQPPNAERSADDLAVIFLDVETTGLSFDSDRVIQLCIRPVLVNRKTYQVTAIAKSKVYNNDPGFPLSQEIIELTNITDADIAGKEIDWSRIHSTLERADFIVCHNASFDRGMVENEFKRAGLNTAESLWACSMNQIFWRGFCRPSRALEVLCTWTGFFYDSHAAANDVDAMIHVLRKNNKIQELLENAVAPDYRVFAVKSPREKNSELKKRRYRWDPSVSCWYKNFNNQAAADSEIEWLNSFDKSVEPEMFEVDPKYRFSPE